MSKDAHMAGWQDKDDLDLTAEDIADMLAGGTPVEVETPVTRTVSLSWVSESFRVAPVTFGISFGRPRTLEKHAPVPRVVSSGDDERLTPATN